MNNFISVAMCTYNGERYIEEQLTSIINQSLKPGEIIICDDRSSDGTTDKINHIIEHCNIPIKLFVNEKKLGVTRNFAKAIAKCQGSYIALSDQDDVWLPEKLKCQSDYLKRRNDLDVLFSNLYRVDEHLTDLNFSMWELMRFTENKKIKWKNGNERMIINQIGNIATGCTMLMRREFAHLLASIIDKGFFKGLIHDHIICLVASDLKKIDYVDQKLALYRQHVNQVIGTETLPNLSMSQKLLKTNRDEHEKSLKILSEEIEVLLSINAPISATFLIEQIKKHVMFRLSLSDKKLTSRFLNIGREYLNGSYKFSNGYKSALKDLISPQ